LADVNLELRPLMVLIGANGIGKTSLLDALSLLAKSAQGALVTTLSDLSGLPAVLTYDRTSDLSLSIAMTVSSGLPLEYLLRLRVQGAAYTIEEETLSQQRTPVPPTVTYKGKEYALLWQGVTEFGPRVRLGFLDGTGDFLVPTGMVEGLPPFKHIDSHGAHIRYYSTEANRLIAPTWEHNPAETSLAQVPKMFREPEEFRKRLASSTFYHVLNVEPRSPVRLPQPMRPASLPGKDGEDLVSCLYSLRETNRDRFEAVQDALRAAFPGFERLDFPPVAAGTLAMTWRDSRFSKPMYMHQLSEGTLRFLWLATLLQSQELTALTLLDEPEVSLHPELLSLLADLLREASRRSQIVVATHSDRLVRFLKPNEVVVMDAAEDGAAQVRWADELDLDAWLRDYTLDELWANGRLGARS
jgi:predicted ATPase